MALIVLLVLIYLSMCVWHVLNKGNLLTYLLY